MELDGCAENAECTDIEGSYICTCSSGFSGDGMSMCDGELLSVTNKLLLQLSNICV